MKTLTMEKTQQAEDRIASLDQFIDEVTDRASRLSMDISGKDMDSFPPENKLRGTTIQLACVEWLMSNEGDEGIFLDMPHGQDESLNGRLARALETIEEKHLDKNYKELVDIMLGASSRV